MDGFFRGLKWASALALVVALIIGGKFAYDFGNIFGMFDKHYEWHQKTTLIVETPEGEISASSAVQVSGRVARGQGISQFGAGASVVEGEAAALEVAPGRWLYVVFDQLSESDRIRMAVRDRYGLMGSAEIMRIIPRMVGEPFTLLGERPPRLITFESPLEPISAAEIDPSNLAASFGPGYSLVDITLEIVREEVTEGGLGPVGEWITTRPPGPLDGNSFRSRDAKYPVANSLNRLSFKKVPQ